MTRARGRALLIAAVVIGAAFLIALAASEVGPKPLPERPANQRPILLLLTSLPLMFGENFSLEQAGSPALDALKARYRVVPISVAEPAQLAKGRLLLMAHPLAQPAEDLVALDQWVRRGGRVLLLADPMLEWPSERPLGDILRPPPMFMDTGLLGHWGLRLDAPDQRGPVVLGGGHPVVFVSPGRLIRTDRNCALSRADIVADCKVGRGRAIVVADADFLNPQIATLQNPSTNNLTELMELLQSLRR